MRSVGLKILKNKLSVYLADTKVIWAVTPLDRCFCQNLDLKAAKLNTVPIELETNWQCRNYAKIRSVTGDPELGGNAEHRAIP
jgi:hypothetical protein